MEVFTMSAASKKNWSTLLKVISYIVTALLGAIGDSALL